jgi:hypothetical protein
VIELWDSKGDWWELVPGWYEIQQRDNREPLQILWCSVQWGSDFRAATGYDRIPVPVFTEWFQ